MFRVKGDTVDIFTTYSDNVLRLTWWDDELDSIEEVEADTFHRLESFEQYEIYPATLFVTTPEQTTHAIRAIQDDLVERIAYFESVDRLAIVPIVCSTSSQKTISSSSMRAM